MTGLSLSRKYLVVYNVVSALAWLYVLVGTGGTFLNGLLSRMSELESRPALEAVRTAAAATLESGETFRKMDGVVRLVQTGAALEIVHVLFGMVRAGLFSTSIQVASRQLLVWVVAALFPTALEAEPAYVTMVLAWSVTEVIRYTFLALNTAKLVGDGLYPLLWLRYSTFIVLYPVGILSEGRCIFRSFPDVLQYGAEAFRLRFGTNPATAWLDRVVGANMTTILAGILVIYIPGSVYLYNHMLRSRKRELGGKRTAGSKKTN